MCVGGRGVGRPLRLSGCCPGVYKDSSALPAREAWRNPEAGQPGLRRQGGRQRNPRRGGKLCRLPERRGLARNPGSGGGGQGVAPLRGRAGAGLRKFPKFLSIPALPPPPEYDVSGPWETENEMLSGFLASVPQPLAVVGFGARGSADAATEYRAFLRAGACRLQRFPPGAPERQPLGPRARGASPLFPFSWLVSHEPRGSGNQGVGGGVRAGRGRQSTYMRRGPADGCQEFPMRGEGGSLGNSAWPNGEPPEGQAPAPRPPPPPGPAAFVHVVPPRRCALIRSERRREVGSPRAPAAARLSSSAFARSAAAGPGAGLARPRQLQPSPALAPAQIVPTPSTPGRDTATAAARRRRWRKKPAPNTRIVHHGPL